MTIIECVAKSHYVRASASPTLITDATKKLATYPSTVFPPFTPSEFTSFCTFEAKDHLGVLTYLIDFERGGFGDVRSNICEAIMAASSVEELVCVAKIWDQKVDWRLMYCPTDEASAVLQGMESAAKQREMEKKLRYMSIR